MRVKKKRRRSSLRYEGGHRTGETRIFCQPERGACPGRAEGWILSRCRVGQDPSPEDQGKEAGGGPVSETTAPFGLVSL